MTLRKSYTSRVLFLMFLGTLLACGNPCQDYTRGILANVCFWDVLGKDLSSRNVKHTYRLLPDGTCYMYRYNYINKERQNSVSHLDKEKGEVDIKWHLKNDSVLTIGNMDFKVDKVDESTIWLETSSANSLVLRKNCSTYIVD